MLRWMLPIMLVSAACEGVLREKVRGEVDADGLSKIEPPPCDPVATPTEDGHHHPGEDCMMCHHQGSTEVPPPPPFTFGGTMFDSSGGLLPKPGTTFHLIDANGTDVIVASQTNGNFYSTDLVTFPVVVFQSLCPDVKPMINPIHDTEGSCNTTGCHTSGFRLH